MCTIDLLEPVKAGVKSEALPDRAGTRRTAGCVMDAADVSVPALRRFARRTVARWGLLTEDDSGLALVVTELVANAVRHSKGSEVSLFLSATLTALTVEVRDNGSWHDHRPPAADGLACGGRGLQLVRAYSARVLVQARHGGTRVIAKLPAV